MTEQSFDDTIDTPSTSHIMQEVIPLEASHRNSVISRSISDKINVSEVNPKSTVTTIPKTLSTASLAMCCTETESDIQSTERQQSITNTTSPSTELLLNDNFVNINAALCQKLLREIESHKRVMDNDNDSFDDEAETNLGDYPNCVEYAITPYNTISSCPICFESATLQASPCCTFQCCNSCWCNHISSTINDGRIKVTCISNDCTKYLTRETIVDFIRADSILLERFVKLYANANQNPRAKTCPRCSHLYSLDQISPIKSTVDSKKFKVKNNNKKIPKQVQCSECSLVWCFRCSAPWHENMTCKQFVKGDKLLLKWTNQKNEEQWNARKCPKCSSFIQRAGGCPHMTCSSCSCEFCYLCGRRYFKVPYIGQHNNKFSMFGCPYNLHPEKPWLRRTIRGMIATGVVVASPLIVVGAVTAAVTVLPTVGIYKLVKHARYRHHRATTIAALVPHGNFIDGEPTINEDLQLDYARYERYRLQMLLNEEIQQFVPRYNVQVDHAENNTTDEFPLAIFADMDVDYLVNECVKPSSDSKTSPVISAMNRRKSHSLDNLTRINHIPMKRRRSIT